MLKLKRKLQFRGHAYYQAVHPEVLSEEINEPENEELVINETSKNTEQDEQEEEIDDPLNEHRAPTNETCIQAIIPDYPVTIDHQNASTGNEIYSVAPGENKHPVSFTMDKQCEELAFPVLFPKGRYGYTTERKIKLTPTKYGYSITVAGLQLTQNIYFLHSL